MNIGPSTTNDKLADVLGSITTDTVISSKLSLEQWEAVNEAETRIRELIDEE